jgi:hypothetical protein
MIIGVGNACSCLLASAGGWDLWIGNALMNESIRIGTLHENFNAMP